MNREKITGNEPAMTVIETRDCSVWVGLTIRQQFAESAMTAIISNAKLVDHANYDIEKICQQSVKAADALIAELNK